VIRKDIHMERENFCCRCKENFPIHGGLSGWQMGQMRPLKRAPKKIKEQFADWLEDQYGNWLCGNCYYDLTDDE